MTAIKSMVLAAASYVLSFAVAFAILGLCSLWPAERLAEAAVLATLTFGLITVRMLIDAYRSGARRTRSTDHATYERPVVRGVSIFHRLSAFARTVVVAASFFCVVTAHLLLFVGVPTHGGVLRACLVWFAASLGLSPVAFSVGAERERERIARSVVEVGDAARAR
jgi:hypothetical protein